MKQIKTIDLNCDLGEGMSNDAQIMPFITSCNISCGTHAGDFNTMIATLELAKKYNVQVGAHPGFDDRANFGRVMLDWSESRFRESVTEQLTLFKKAADQVGVQISHVKMHGALYHAVAYNATYAQWAIAVIEKVLPGIALVVPTNSIFNTSNLNGNVQLIQEAFADRRYDNSGDLVPRSQENAVITDVNKVVNQLAQMVHLQTVTTVKEKEIHIVAQTYCIHGDNHLIVNTMPDLIDKLATHFINITNGSTAIS